MKYDNTFTKGNLTLGIAGVVITVIAYITQVVELEIGGVALGMSVVKTIRLVANAMNKTIQISRLKSAIRSKGEKSLMKKFFKWVFKSNPKTWAMILSLILACLGAVEAYVNNLELGIYAPIVAIIFTTIAGYLAATKTGFETNKEADERKAEEAKKVVVANKA